MSERATRSRNRLTAALLVVVVVAAAAAGAFTWLGTRAEAPRTAQEAALEAARTRVPDDVTDG